MKTIKLFSRILPLMLGLFMAACNNDGTIDVPVDSVVIEPSTLTIAVGDTATLTATIYPQDATNKNIIWSTSDNSVVSVTSMGVVEGIAEGNATITVMTLDGGRTATCSVEVTGGQSGGDDDIYVCGTINYEAFVSTAVYWKNGVMIELGEQGVHSFTKQILEYNGDIYISGGTEDVAGYWKNGEFNALPSNTGNVEVYGFQIVNGDIYACGYDGYKAVYWKNDQLYQLEETTSYGYGLFVDGNDVYVVGSKPGTGPMVWKNGVGELFSDTGASINMVYVEGDDIYVGGEKNDCVAYWINDTLYESQTEYESYLGTNGMAVHNGKVYLTGEDLIDYDWYTFYAAYWVDGEFFTLKGDPAYPSTASSIKFFGDDMYVAGKEKDYEIINHAAYWKNGEIVILDTTEYDTEAADILLVQAQ